MPSARALALASRCALSLPGVDESARHRFEYLQLTRRQLFGRRVFGEELLKVHRDLWYNLQHGKNKSYTVWRGGLCKVETLFLLL